MDLGAESLRLDGQVHDHGRGQRGITLGERQHGAGMHLAVGNRIADAVSDEFDSRVGHDRERRAVRGGNQLPDPLFHVPFHNAMPILR